jgi:hypothetical protein
MTPDEVKQNITNWCSSDDDLQVAGDRLEPSTDFAMTIRAGALGGTPIELEVLQGQGADRVTIRRSTTIGGDVTSAARNLVDSRPGTVSASIERSGSDTSVTAQTFVYVDGLNKHTFVQAADEMARTSRLLDALPAGRTAAAATQPAVVQTPTPAPLPQPAYASPSPSPTPWAAAGAAASQPVAAQPTAAPSWQQQAQPQQQQQPLQQQQQPQPQPQPAAAQWMPTHSVPPQGLRAWGAPDPSGPVVANLAPSLPIQVTEVRGAWARIVCSNGWTGWVDGRIIGVAA